MKKINLIKRPRVVKPTGQREFVKTYNSTIGSVYSSRIVKL